MFVEPLTGLRWVDVYDRRTKKDWALEVALVAKNIPNAKKNILVCDVLNAHTYGAFYEAFPPDEAARLCKLVEIRHTPVHGSWLNIAECELSVMTRQCLKNRCFQTIKLLQSESYAWYVARTPRKSTVNWQFTTEEARIKLKSTHPLF